MLVEPLLRGLVVVGRNAQDGVGAPQVEFAQLIQYLRRRVAAAAHHQRYAPRDVVGDEHGYHGALGHVERRRLGRGAQRHDVVHAAFDHIVDHACQRLVVNFSFGCKGGYHGGPHAAELVSYHMILFGIM